MRRIIHHVFEVKNQLFWFLIIMSLTIFFTRILTQFFDPNFIIKGYELHHFYYGVGLLAIISLSTIFGKFHPRLYLVLTAFAFGLITDEFIFILGKFSNVEYSSTLGSAIFSSFVVLCILGIIIYDVFGKIKK